jgi:hypothetical protein
MERFQDLVGRRSKGRFKVLPLVSANVSTNAQRDRGSGTHQRDEDNGPSASNGLSLARGQPFPLVFQLVFDLSHRDGMIAFGRFLQIGMVGLNAIHRVHLSRILSKLKNLQVRGGPLGLSGHPARTKGQHDVAGLHECPCVRRRKRTCPIYCLIDLLPGSYRLVKERPRPRPNQPVREGLFTSFWAANIIQEVAVSTSMALLGGAVRV